MSAPKGRLGPALTLATLLLPGGPIRTRYRRELRAELEALPLDERAAYVHGALRAMPALARTVRIPRVLLEEGAEFEPALKCRLHLGHGWADAYTEDGQHYRRCRHCGMDRQGASSNANDGIMLGQHSPLGM